MEFMELIKDRWSVRDFQEKPIEPEKLEKILEAAKYAPTAVNFQPQHIYVLKSPEAMKKINAVCKSVYGAPTVLLICYDEEQAWKNPYDGQDSGKEDASIVATHMMLEAWELGIGSCWVGMFDAKLISKAFDLPQNIKPVLLLPIGYASEDAVPYAPWHSVFKPMDRIVTEL